MCVRGFVRVILLGVWLWILPGGLAQSLPAPEVVSPQSQQVYAWGKEEPSVRIEVRATPSSPIVRHFVTANILTTTGRLVERVSLYDDGTHTDKVAGDGVFTSIYTLREKGTFQIKARLQQTDSASGTSHEKWSEPVVFSVEQVPYVDITSPSHDARVASVTKVSASLLIGSQQQLYHAAGEDVRVRCWAEPEAKAIVPEKPSGSFSTRIEFPRPGRYRLLMAAQTLRNGQWIESEPDSVWVNVVSPPMWPFWMGAMLIGVALLLPPKQVWLYRHTLEIHAKNGSVHKVEIHPQKLKDVNETVGGAGCSKQVPGAQGTLFTLTAKPGEKFLRVQVGDEWQDIRPHPCSIAFQAGDWAVYYRECKAAGKVRLPLWTLTIPKAIVIFMAIMALLYGAWIYWRFAQMLPSS